MALALIVRALVQSDVDSLPQAPLVDRAVELLLQIRPKSRPNALVLQFGLEQFLLPDSARPAFDWSGEPPGPDKKPLCGSSFTW